MLCLELPTSDIFAGVTFGISQLLGALLLRGLQGFAALKQIYSFQVGCGETYVWHPASKLKREKKKQNKKKHSHTHTKRKTLKSVIF